MITPANGEPLFESAYEYELPGAPMRAHMLAEGTRDRLAAWWHDEIAHGSLFNFMPIGIAVGISLWYAAPAAPSLVALALAALVLLAIALRGQGDGRARILLPALACTACGALLAGVEIERNAMPVPQSGLTGTIEGVVLATDSNRRGSPRYVIRPVSIEGLSEGEIPRLIRVSASRAKTVASPGDAIRGLARLSPPQGPLYPGGYDFAYYNWLSGLGLTGFFMGSAQIGQGAAGIDLAIPERLIIGQNRLRQAIAQRIRAAVPGEAGQVAVALITGDRSGMSEETQESLRRSGLAHILAISGLHMALVTLTVIGAVRLGFAALPRIADRFAVRKWALVAGLVAATLYLFISGGSVATQRAWIMMSVMILAGLMDRQAITMRNVAIAATIILVFSPSSLFHPGFQMSFAAVAALVAAYGAWTRHRRRRYLQGEWQPAGPFPLITGYVAGLAATSIIAGLATGLFAAWHFHRIAPLGLYSNLAAMPVVSLLVMPSCLLGALLMPFGFEKLALVPAGKAIDFVRTISDHVNSFGLDTETGLLPAAMPAVAGLFLALACGLRTPLRLLALMPLGALAVLALRPAAVPDILVSQDGRAIALQQLVAGASDEPQLALVNPQSGQFAGDIWRRAYLPNRDYLPLVPDGACDRDYCSAQSKDRRVIVVYDPDLIAQACLEADILLTPRLWFADCNERKPGLIITRRHLEIAGSHAIFIDGGTTLRIETAWPVADAGVEGIPIKRRFAWQARYDNVSRRFAAYRQAKGDEPGVRTGSR